MIKRLLAMVSLLASLAGMAVADVAPPFSYGQSLIVVGEGVALRSGPYKESALVATLAEYDGVEFLGEYTVEPITVRFRGKDVTAPYIKVRTYSGNEGWLFAGLVVEDQRSSLLRQKLSLVSIGDSLDRVLEYYGQNYAPHDARMKLSETQFILKQLGTSQAWEYYYFQTSEGIVFGHNGSEVLAILIRQEHPDFPTTTFWRSLDGYKLHRLQPECHFADAPASCSEYRI